MGVPMGNVGGHSGHRIFVYKPSPDKDTKPAKKIYKAPMAEYGSIAITGKQKLFQTFDLKKKHQSTNSMNTINHNS